MPHAGHDRDAVPFVVCVHDFNSRAPCGARPFEDDVQNDARAFQLTCPMRGTTYNDRGQKVVIYISTHVPHAGHDFPRISKVYPQYKFQLTRPRRGTTNYTQ